MLAELDVLVDSDVTLETDSLTELLAEADSEATLEADSLATLLVDTDSSTLSISIIFLE